MQTRPVVAVIAKNPFFRAKTRLGVRVGTVKAGSIASALVQDTVRNVTNPHWRRVLLLEPATPDSVRHMRNLGVQAPVLAQSQGNLGSRLCDAARRLLSLHPAVAIVAADAPLVTTKDLAKAFALLKTKRADVVLKPAFDGGYAFIALSKPHAVLFEGVSWGTNRVLRQTLAQAKRHGLRARLLSPTLDVDRVADLRQLARIARHNPTPRELARRTLAAFKRPAFSVIIPAFNEAGRLPRAIRSARNEKARGVELIVSDGGSTDGTIAIAKRQGVRVVHAWQANRAVQLNAGARAARGDVFVFLHADCRLPKGWPREVENALARPGVVGGAFTLDFDGKKGARLSALLAVNQWRSRVTRHFYGDQAVFCTRNAFEAVGGFREGAPCEDVDFSKRLKHVGKTVLLHRKVTASARAFHKTGFGLTLARYALLRARHAFTPR